MSSTIRNVPKTPLKDPIAPGHEIQFRWPCSFKRSVLLCQGHGHLEGKPFFQAQGVQRGVDQRVRIPRPPGRRSVWTSSSQLRSFTLSTERLGELKARAMSTCDFIASGQQVQMPEGSAVQVPAPRTGHPWSAAAGRDSTRTVGPTVPATPRVRTIEITLSTSPWGFRLGPLAVHRGVARTTRAVSESSS